MKYIFVTTLIVFQILILCNVFPVDTLEQLANVILMVGVLILLNTKR